MTHQRFAVRTPRSAWFAIVLLIGLLGVIVAAVFAVGLIAPIFGLFAGVVGLVLYPGLAGIVAARSRSSDTVVAVATLVPTVLFTLWVLSIIGSPWGWPSKRVIAIAVAVCLLFAGVLFGTLLAAASVARPGGVLRAVAAISVGAQGFLLLVVPSMLLVLLQGNHT